MQILMYHSIGEEKDRFSVSPERFEQQMDWLAHGGVQVRSLQEALGAPGDRRTVVLTFDDGFASVYEYGLPLLRRYGLPATVFLVTDAVGKEACWEGAPQGEALMTWEQVREMAAEGFEFGSHTATHLDLRRAEVGLIEEELAHSRTAIEEHTGQEGRAFAYPFWYFRAEMPALLARAGYRCGLLAGTYGRNTGSTDVYALHRIPIWRGDPLGAFRAKATGRTAWRYYTQKLAREVCWQMSSLRPGGRRSGGQVGP